MNGSPDWRPQPPTADPAAPVAGPTAAPMPAQTGHPAVDTALRTLAEVADADPVEQLPAFQAAHRSLRETLTSIDEEG